MMWATASPAPDGPAPEEGFMRLGLGGGGRARRWAGHPRSPRRGRTRRRILLPRRRQSGGRRHRHQRPAGSAKAGGTDVDGELRADGGQVRRRGLRRDPRLRHRRLQPATSTRSAPATRWRRSCSRIATAAFEPFIINTIRNAEALFIAGGDQSDYVNFWKNTPSKTRSTSWPPSRLRWAAPARAWPS